MKVIRKQRNSRKCIICGLDNEYGLRAPFYSMEDGSVMTKFTFRELHQSYPNRVHGGLITAMLDEMGLRALWAQEGSEDTFGVTVSLETKFRRPVPYNEELIGKGMIRKRNSKFVITDVSIMNKEGNILANGIVKYIIQDANKIDDNVSIHDEMCYKIQDEVKEINL